MHSKLKRKFFSPESEKFYAFALFSAIYWYLKLPTLHLHLPYLDDGETLYHALSILEGKVPYLEDITHHNIGYVIPFVILGLLFNVSASLIPMIGFLVHTVTALILSRIARISFSFPLSLCVGALSVSAAEPWVLGLFPLYFVALLLVAVWWYGLDYRIHLRSSSLFLASLLSGFAFLVDQRGVILILIPLFAIIRLKRLRQFPLLIAGVASLPLFTLVVFYLLGALIPWYEQTLVYPFIYRSAEGGVFGAAYTLITSIVFAQAPLLTIVGSVGFFLSFRDFFSKEFSLDLSLSVLISAALIASLGGRSLPYYAIPFYPLLAFYSAFLALTLNRFSRKGPFLITLPVIFTLAEATNLRTDDAVRNYRGDGSREIVSRIMSEDPLRTKSLLVWGYHPDIYIFTQRTSPLGFSDRILIHPDQGVTSPDGRLRSIYPKYQKRFIDSFLKDPPWFIALTSKDSLLSSPSDKFVKEQLHQFYEEILAVKGEDLTGKSTHYFLYRKKL